MKGDLKMSSKINFFKKVSCFMIILALMITSLSTTALAADRSKTVTYETTYTFLITPSQYPDYMNSPSSYVPTTYKYNDGTYKGTLNLTYATCYAPDGVVGTYLRVKILTKYTGTVLALVPSKSVTYEKTYKFLISPSQFPDYMNVPSSYVPPVYFYNDGTYSGYIYLSYAVCLSPTAVGNYLEVGISTRYSGTVLHK